MGMRGPQRKPGSRRWNQEVGKKQKVGLETGKRKKVSAGAKQPDLPDFDLPSCPDLPRRVSERWNSLVIDMIAAGIQVKQLDARSISIAAGYEADLMDLESLCGNDDLDADQRLAAIRLKNQTRKDYLSALMAIGGTPVVRLRARIAPEEKPQKENDPWRDL